MTYHHLILLDFLKFLESFSFEGGFQPGKQSQEPRSDEYEDGETRVIFLFLLAKKSETSHAALS